MHMDLKSQVRLQRYEIHFKWVKTVLKCCFYGFFLHFTIAFMALESKMSKNRYGSILVTAFAHLSKS